MQGISKLSLNNLHEFNPFDCQDSMLRSVFTRIAANESDGINFDEAKKIGKEINLKLENIAVNNAVIKRTKQVKSLASLRPGVKMNGEIVHNEPNVLFQSLAMLKSVLGKTLTKDPKVQIKMRGSTDYVLNGGALMHRLYWNLPAMYREVTPQYFFIYNKKVWSEHLHFL